CKCRKMAEASISVDQDQFSCPVCLDLLKDPVTIHCGHSYCMVCINGCWDQEDQSGVYRCPQCRETFTPRPVLRRNNVMAEVVEKLKKTELRAAPFYAGPEDVECDSCTGRKRKASKSCLVCLTSYCNAHLKPHYQSPAFKKHKLVEASKQLQEKICSQHDEVMKIYCRTDQSFICYLCMLEEHKDHDTVPVAAERSEKQDQLKEVQMKSQQRLQEKEKKLQEVRQAVETLKSSAQAAVEDSERIFTQLIRSIEKKRSEVTELIRAQERTELSWAEELLEKLEQEIADLQRRDTELEQLKLTEDHIQFLQSFQSVCVSSGSEDSPSIIVHQRPSFDGVKKSLSDLKATLKEFCKQEFSKIPPHGKRIFLLWNRMMEIFNSAAVRIILPSELKTREEFLQYYRRLTLNPGTLSKYLRVSERNRVVTFGGKCQRYSDHPERFDYWCQVLSKQSVSGRCYWEVEWSSVGGDVYISVSYEGIRRKGRGDESSFGHNSQSWSLQCSPTSLSFWHNNIQTEISAPSSSRIGVYVDHSAGTLSFYSITDTMTLLLTVHTTFTQPLYAGFWIDGWSGLSGGSVMLCNPKGDSGNQLQCKYVKLSSHHQAQHHHQSAAPPFSLSLSVYECRKMAEASILVDQDRFTCPVCLDLLKDPVTTPCGHSYCMVCINGCWDQEDQRRVYRCPQCRETFTPRPVLRRNNMLAEVVEDVKKKLRAAPPALCYAGPGDVECDSCTGRKLKAVKSCLVCLASFCEAHLKPHYQSPAFKKHKLVEASKQLQEKICSQHDRLIEIYCRTDQSCICYLCVMHEHRGHDTVAASAERSEKQNQLKREQRKSQQRLQEKEKELQEVKQAVKTLKSSAQAAVEDSERIFTQLIRSIEKKRSEVTELIRAQEKTELSRAEELLEKLEQEIADLKRRDTELEQLEHTEDHIQFLQSFQSLRISSVSFSSAVHQHFSFDGLKTSLSALKKRLEKFLNEEFSHILPHAAAVQGISTSRPKTREDFLRYYCHLTLDPNTAYYYLTLSERNRVVTESGKNQHYPDHPERFDYCFQVLCKESVSGRCYWEVEWGTDGYIDVAVSYKGISRKGENNASNFGENNQSWSLKRSFFQSLSFYHNNIQTKISAPPSSRIGVYVDHSAGTLSFYRISRRSGMTLLHTVHTTFTQPLYAGFMVYGGSTQLKKEQRKSQQRLQEKEKELQEVKQAVKTLKFQTRLHPSLFLSLSVGEYRKMEQASILVDQDQFNCPICLHLLKDPVTTPCGHSFCMVCINGSWDQEDQRGVYRCPQCRETFTPRPVLRRNNMLAEVVEKLRRKELQAASLRCTGPGDVECDSCTGRKLKAVKSCLVCLASYCEAHLKPHYQSPAFKEHKLVEASKQLQEKICSQHGKLIEIYCRTDQSCICYLCSMDEHRGHDTVAAAAERSEKQNQLKETQRTFQQRLQEKEKELQEVKQAVKTLKSSAQAAMEDSERIFTQLIRSIEKKRSEVTELIRAQEKTELSGAEELLEKLEQEIADLKRRDTELEQLEHTEDHIQFLKSFQSLCVSSGSEDSRNITVHHRPSFDGVRKSLSDLKKRLEEFWKQEFSKISFYSERCSPDEEREGKSLPAQSLCNRSMDYCQLTLDPNTVHQNLRLSKKNKIVTFSGINQHYPDHPERFDYWNQVLSKESVSGRCYWEVECSNDAFEVSISVSYKGIRRKGWGDECKFGHNSQSWSLQCIPFLSFCHNNIQTEISAPPSSRIGVYVDHSAGTLSFYSVSDTMTLLHTVHTTFTQPLYTGFSVNGVFLYRGGHILIKLCNRSNRVNQNLGKDGVKSAGLDTSVLESEVFSLLSLFFYHNNIQTEISAPSSSRIGVYVDHSAGTLSFYSISDTMTLLHTVHTTFTQPLYAGFWVNDLMRTPYVGFSLLTIHIPNQLKEEQRKFQQRLQVKEKELQEVKQAVSTQFCECRKMAEASISVPQDRFTCPVCLDLLKDPVTTPCGHSYCMVCINGCWNQECQWGIYRCPQCRETFNPRPVLRRNNMLAEVVEDLKKKLQTAPLCHAGPGDVECDSCTGRKLKAVKHCLVCLAPYCEAHLERHYQSPAFKKHKLVEASKQLQEKICSQHDRLIEIYCRTDQQNQLKEAKKKSQQRLQQKEKKLQEVKQAVKTLKDPVTTPCGHSYCMVCINGYWDQEDQRRGYRCPQCRETFTPRPVLRRNNMLAEVVEEVKQKLRAASLCYAGPGDVECDSCTGKKRKASKSCLVCLTSYCEAHLKPHYQSPAFKKHKLVEASKQLQEKICSQHDRLIEIYCRTDQSCICYLCLMDEHRGHDSIAAAAERSEKQKQLKQMQKKSQRILQRKLMNLQEVKQTVNSFKSSAQAAVEDSERIFTQLIRSIEKKRSEVTELIRAQEKTELSRAEGLLEKLEQEIADLKRRDTELEQLEHTEDPIQFLQSFQSLCVSSGSEDSPSITVHPHPTFDGVRKSLSDMKERLEEFWKQEFSKIPPHGKRIFLLWNRMMKIFTGSE
ncbi:hypothetical protein NFI96_023572, partial [Prochilodus magdalenae]